MKCAKGGKHHNTELSLFVGGEEVSDLFLCQKNIVRIISKSQQEAFRKFVHLTLYAC